VSLNSLFVCSGDVKFMKFMAMNGTKCFILYTVLIKYGNLSPNFEYLKGKENFTVLCFTCKTL
jgi:hypothetical protein